VRILVQKRPLQDAVIRTLFGELASAAKKWDAAGQSLAIALKRAGFRLRITPEQARELLTGLKQHGKLPSDLRKGAAAAGLPASQLVPELDRKVGSLLPGARSSSGSSIALNAGVLVLCDRQRAGDR
jgi:hypothetical protein